MFCLKLCSNDILWGLALDFNCNSEILKEL